MSDMIVCAEDILRVDHILKTSYHVHPCLGDSALIPLLPDLPNAVVVGEGAAKRENGIPGLALHLFIDLNRIPFHPIEIEPKIKVHARAGVIELRHPTRDEGASNAPALAAGTNLGLDPLTSTVHCRPAHRGLKRFSDEVIVEADIAEVCNEEGKGVAALAVL